MSSDRAESTAAGAPRQQSSTASSGSSNASSTSSDEVSSTLSNSSSSSSSSSSSHSSSSSGFESSDSERPSSPPQGQNAVSVGRAAATQQPQQQQQQQQRHVQLNPELRFERPDKEYIPPPPLKDMQDMAKVLFFLSTDKKRYPDGRHRTLDYFRAAVEMFVTEVRQEYQRQYQQAQRSGRAMQRLTWKNSGELAICFACCCDNVKLLYDNLQPGPLKPLWDAFVGQLAPMLIVQSRVPEAMLSSQTYHIKYMDWVKGGTRYGGEQSAANVRFPSALDRRVKVETYLRSGAGYKIEAVQVGTTSAASAAVPAGVTPRPPLAAGAAPVQATETRAPFAGRLPGTGAVKLPVVPGVGGPRPPVKVAMKHVSGGVGPGSVTTATAPRLASTGVKQMPPEMKRLFWLSVLAHVKGGDASRAFPDDRLEALPGLLRLCEMTEHTEEMCILMDVLAASSSSVQTVFERLGGLLSFRRFASHFIQSEEAEPLMQLIEQLARWRVVAWGSTSQQAWQTDMNQRRTRDLMWLRTLPLIPEAKRPAWGALLLVMEQRYIFKAPRPDDADMENPLKRRRPEGESGYLHAMLSDNVDMQRWVVPRVNVFSAVRLPVELRVPPLCTKLEEDTVRFLNSKRDYAEKMQVVWRERLEKILSAQPRAPGAAVSVPLWYDPYALLSVASPQP
ncbi:hypothetical protein LPMP_350390 [Leishmania panamensis]|uniref:Uncharacterized protein n=1 Tax=Leishmania panamensis TaxID=5679 RepID=A0A088S1D9_LEIPA|nr:hypothetical protein LPMP_350390 [Leishmania panamensis]AIO02178.1 hypothetical protein LPMP_350390 [Leishmania panamensis]